MGIKISSVLRASNSLNLALSIWRLFLSYHPSVVCKTPPRTVLVPHIPQMQTPLWKGKNFSQFL